MLLVSVSYMTTDNVNNYPHPKIQLFIFGKRFIDVENVEKTLRENMLVRSKNFCIIPLTWLTVILQDPYSSVDKHRFTTWEGDCKSKSLTLSPRFKISTCLTIYVFDTKEIFLQSSLVMLQNYEKTLISDSSLLRVVCGICHQSSPSLKG